MRLLDQVKTTQGRIPVSSVRLEDAEDGSQLLCFDVCLPETVGPEDAERTPSEPRVEDFAFLWGGAGQVSGATLCELARRTGPLFGASETELLADWLAEAGMARDVVTLQEAVNGSRPLSSVDGRAGSTALVSKSIVRNRKTRNTFSIFAYSIPVSAGVSEAFFCGMPEFPHFEKFAAKDSRDYVFITREYEDGGVEGGAGQTAYGDCRDTAAPSLAEYLTVTLFSFEREVSTLDFAAATQACGIDEDDMNALIEQAREDSLLSLEELPTGLLGLLAEPGVLQYAESFLEKDDGVHLQRLVQAVVSLRLHGIEVDVFRSSENDDFLAFPSYAGYLWYGFAKRLGQVKIGYCPVCGRGFSLAGHRGIAREYCSASCKTKAKNARAKRQRDEARRLFLEEGRTIEQTAQAVYAEELSEQARSNKRKTLAEACGAVRRSLRECPKLKHVLDDDLRAGEGAPFARRCLEEGVFGVDYLAARAKRLGVSNQLSISGCQSMSASG